MALTKTESDWMEGLINAYDGNEGMVSDWARGFMKDQVERWTKYGKDMFLSPKQWAVLQRTAESIGYEGPSLSGGEEDYGVRDERENGEIPF